MSALGDIFTTAGVAQEKLVEIVALLKQNPLAAMSAVQELKLSDTVMQQIMGVVDTCGRHCARPAAHRMWSA